LLIIPIKTIFIVSRQKFWCKLDEIILSGCTTEFFWEKINLWQCCTWMCAWCVNVIKTHNKRYKDPCKDVVLVLTQLKTICKHTLETIKVSVWGSLWIKVWWNLLICQIHKTWVTPKFCHLILVCASSEMQSIEDASTVIH